MTSKVSIISDAYFQLGKNPINTLSPQIAMDVGASAIYDRVVPATLSVFDYPFARKQQQLNLNSDSPTDSYYTNSFKLPNDFLAFVSFDECTIDFDYKIMGSNIWANQDTLTINYIYESSINLFPPQFCLYLTYLMCEHLAYPITNKADVQAYWEKKANFYYGIAASTIANQEPSKVIKHAPLLSEFNAG